MLHFEDEVLLDYTWIETDKIEFKLLIMSSVLAIENRAFLGTIDDITSYLGISNNATNHSKINKALNNLSNQGFIKLFKDKANYIIALSYNAKSNSKIIAIQRTWIELIRTYKNKNNVAWETILRIFLYLLGNTDKYVLTYKEIAQDLKISVSTIQKAIKVICSLDFGNLRIDKRAIYNNEEIDGKTLISCLGTNFSIMTNFENLRIVQDN